MGEAIDDEASAALKIQSLQRGRNARKEVDHKKEEAQAAKKIQSMQRGKMARQEVQAKRGGEGNVFVRPFEEETDEQAVVLVNRKILLRKFACFEELLKELQACLPLKTVDSTQIYYSTTEHPQNFSSRITAAKMEEYRACTELELTAARVHVEHKKLLKEAVSPLNEEGIQKPKSQLAAEEKAREKRLKQGAAAIEMVWEGMWGVLFDCLIAM